MAADKSLKDLASAVYKIAENSPKIQKDVKDIRDAICGTEGILESLYGISKSMEDSKKKDAISKLTGKKSNPIDQKTLLKSTGSITTILKDILDAVKNVSKGGGRPSGGRKLDQAPESRTDRKIKGLEAISKSIEIVERLKNIKLKDFLFTKKKMKNLSNIMTRSLNLFRNFKDQKEAEATISFINSSIDIVKKLGKVWVISKPAQWGAKAIEKIFLGGKTGRGGLIAVFRKVNRHQREIRRGAVTLKLMSKSVGSMFLATIALVGIAALALPAMLGALLMKGVVWLLIGTFKLLSRSARTVAKGSLVLLLMSSSIIAFGLGLMAMAKAVRDMKLKDVGLMLASIVGVGLAMAGVGLLAVPIALGSAVMLLMGVSLGLFALSIMAWRNLDSKKAMANIKEAVGGLREVFGLELGKGEEGKSFGQRLGGALMDIAMAILNFGKSLFVMGTILLAGAALGMLYVGLRPWTNFDGKKAAANIGVAVGALKDVFGLNDVEGSAGDKLKALGGNILDLAVAIFSAGKTLVVMGTIVLATAMMDIIRLTLIPWEKYDAKPAAKNMKIAIDALKEVFGLQEAKGLGGKLGGLFGGLLDMGVALMQSGKTLIQMGTLVLACGMADLIRLELKPWDEYDPKKAITNMSNAITSLKDLFGLKDTKGLGGKLGGLFGGLLDMGVALMQSGKTLITMGTLAIAAGMAESINKSLRVWDTYNGKSAIKNMSTAITTLKDVFGLKEPEGGFWSKLKALGGGVLDMGIAMMQAGKVLIKMGTIATACGLAEQINKSLRVWDKYTGTTAVRNMSIAISELKNTFGLNDTEGSNWDKVKALGGGMLDMGIALMQSGKTLIHMGTLAIACGMAERIAKSLHAWDEYGDPTTAIKNMGVAVTGLKDLFGLNDTEGSNWDKVKKLGGGMLDIGIALMQSGKVLIKMGTIAIATGMGEKIAKSLHAWDKYGDPKTAIKNMGVAITGLKNLFGLNDVEGGAWDKIKKLGGGMLDIGVALMQSGKVLVKMGTIAIACGMAAKIAKSLHAWDEYDSATAISNMEKAITKLKEVFGLNDTEGGFKDKLKSLGGSMLDMGIAMMQSGKTLSRMGTIVVATGMAKYIAKYLKVWDEYDPTVAVKNITIAVSGLKTTFGLNDENSEDVKSGGSKLFGSLFDLGSSLLQMGKTFRQMGTLIIATGAMDLVKLNLRSWDKYDPTDAVTHIKMTFDGLMDAFGLNKPEEEVKTSKLGGFFKGVADIVTAPMRMIGNMFDIAEGLTESGSRFAKLANLLKSSAAMLTIKHTIEPWDKFDSANAIKNIKNTIINLSDLFESTIDNQRLDKIGPSAITFKKASVNIKAGLDNIRKGLVNNKDLKNAVTPIKQTVNAVNALDMEKASTMIEMFQSFTKIGVKPFDKFTAAVEKFSESCKNLIDSLESFEPSVGGSYESSGGTSEGGGSISPAESVTIKNTRDLASAIADAIKSLPISAEVNMSDIRLVVDGTSGRKVTLTLDN